MKMVLRMHKEASWEHFKEEIKSDNPLHKIFNRNTIKMSYKCMPNIGQAIFWHNSQLLSKKADSAVLPMDSYESQ